MDYELMMNGNVKIGQRAPEFEANTTMGKVSLNDYTRKMVSIIFASTEILPPYNLTIWGGLKDILFQPKI